MTYRFMVGVLILVAAGVLRADPPSADKWLIEYQKLGGKGSIDKLDHGGLLLAIEKRSGQKPLVSLKEMKLASGVRTVGLQGYEVDDSDLEALAAWKEVERIQVVDGKKVTDKGIKAIARLPNLRSVELVDSSVTGEGLSAFSGHKALVHFTLSNTVISGQVRTLELKDLPRLETISISGEGITKVRLTNLPRLRQVSDFPRSLESSEFSELGELAELDFQRTALKSLSLSKVPKLESLNVKHTRLNDKMIADIKTAHPSIKVER